jgi:hypothetical protein
MHPLFRPDHSSPFKKGHSDAAVINVVVSVDSDSTRLTTATNESYSLDIFRDSQEV